MIEITVDALPPSVNHAHVRTKRGAVRSPEFDAFALLVRHATAHVSRPAWIGARGVVVEIDVGINHRRDLDNCLKVLLDSLAAALQFDDRHIEQITIRRDSTIAGKTRYRIGRLAEDAAEAARKIGGRLDGQTS